jgi:hypothetical protein
MPLLVEGPSRSNSGSRYDRVDFPAADEVQRLILAREKPLLARPGRGSCVTSNAGPHGLRNCTREEGRSFEGGNQVLMSNHRKLL